MERDGELCALLARARCLTTEQVARAAFRGKHEKWVEKRLRALAAIGVEAFPRAYLKRKWFRTAKGQDLMAWSLTPLGYLAAEVVLGEPVQVPAKDVGEAFRQHEVTLNELLVLLAEPWLEGSFVRVERLPFRWIPSESSRLPWKQYDVATGRERAKVMTLPTCDRTIERKIERALSRGDRGIRKIAKDIGVGTGTVQRIKAAMAA